MGSIKLGLMSDARRLTSGVRLSRYFILLTLLFNFLFNQAIYAYQGSNELIHIPSAKMEKLGYIELGTSFYYTIENQKGYFPQESFFRTALSENFELGIKVQDGVMTQSLHGCFSSSVSADKQTAQYWALGFKDIGWIDPGVKVSYPVYQFFLSYTYSFLKSGLNFHVGAGKDRANADSFTPFFGADQKLPYGKIMAEWDGRGFNVGYRYSTDRYHLFFTFTPMPALSIGGQARVFSVGLSFYENVLDTMLENWKKTRLKVESSLVNVNTRLSVVEARNRAAMDIMSVDFLQELEKAFLEKKLIDKQLEESTKSVLKVAISHMQKGLEHYYQEDFKKALEEYKVVISMMPNLAIGYVRLGSIYLQLNEKDAAIKSWQKALKLNPDDKRLEKYLNNLLQREQNNTSSQLQPINNLEGEE